MCFSKCWPVTPTPFSYVSTSLNPHTQAHAQTHKGTKNSSMAAMYTLWFTNRFIHDMILLKVFCFQWHYNRRSQPLWSFSRLCCFTQGSFFHPLMMGFLWNWSERNSWFNLSGNLCLAIAQMDSYWVMAMIMEPCPCHTPMWVMQDIKHRFNPHMIHTNFWPP